MLVEALKSAPCVVLGEALSSLLKGVLIPAYGVPCYSCVGGGGAANEGFIPSISSTSYS